MKNCMPFGWRLLQSIWFLFLHSRAEKGPSLTLIPWLLSVLLGEGETTEPQGYLVCREGTENRKRIASIYKCSLRLVSVSHLPLWFCVLYGY